MYRIFYTTENFGFRYWTNNENEPYLNGCFQPFCAKATLFETLTDAEEERRSLRKMYTPDIMNRIDIEEVK